MKRIAMGFALAILLCASITAWAQDETEFTFQTVVYPGDTFTELLGINRAGTIVGYHGATVHNGFVLTSPGAFTSQSFPGSAQTQVFGINNSNDTVGIYNDSQGFHGYVQKGGVYTRVDVAFHRQQGGLLGINDLNQAVGYYLDPSGHNVPYIYDEGGGIFELIWNVPSRTGVATGINNSGQVTGYYVDVPGKTHGWLLSPGVEVPISFPGSPVTQPMGLNNSGVVVGVYLDTSGNRHGFVYNPKSTDEIYDSIDEPDGVGTTTITGINDNGQVVGYFVDSSGNTDGFVGTPIS